MMWLQAHAQHPSGPAQTISSAVRYNNSPKKPINQSRHGLNSNTDDCVQYNQQLDMHPQYITFVPCLYD